MKVNMKHVQIDPRVLAPSKCQAFFSVELRVIQRDYCGVFAKERIPEKSVVFQDGGRVVSSIEEIPLINRRFLAVIGQMQLLIPAEDEVKEVSWFVNHSCNPNLMRIGTFTYVAKREISVGDELTTDYAPLAAGLNWWSMKCVCNASNCRKIISGKDWKKSELAKQLWQEWPPFIQRELIYKGKI